MSLYEWHWARLKGDLDLRESPNYVPGYMRKPEYQNITEFICEGTIVLCHASRDLSTVVVQVDRIPYIIWQPYDDLFEPLDESLQEQLNAKRRTG